MSNLDIHDTRNHAATDSRRACCPVINPVEVVFAGR